jgi:hypothetical protein
LRAATRADCVQAKAVIVLPHSRMPFSRTGAHALYCPDGFLPLRLFAASSPYHSQRGSA